MLSKRYSFSTTTLHPIKLREQVSFFLIILLTVKKHKQIDATVPSVQGYTFKWRRRCRLKRMSLF